ncbi:MAG TPA: HEAT repeat domain-containing protein [Polyangia bacterium]|nr:HEAT repeat domain-containing protein [Polyangia bacterium]
MSVASLPLGPFRGFVAFDEAAADVFFGRSAEIDALVERVVAKGERLVAVTGEAGVGKSSLVRAGLGAVLAKRGIPLLYVASPTELAAEVQQAASRAGGSPQAPGEPTADYVTRLARETPSGLVVILDHLEEVLLDEAPPSQATALGGFVARVAEGAGPRVHFVLVVDRAAFASLDRLGLPAALQPRPGAWLTVERLDEATVIDILDRTAQRSGTFFDAGLPAAVAADLCRTGRALPLELQLCARALVDHRITSTRRYQAAGGITSLHAMFFEHTLGGPEAVAARRVLLDVASAGASTSADIEARTHLPRQSVTEALRILVGRGVLGRHPGEPDEKFVLAHPALRPFIDTFGIEDRARAEAMRRRLRSRLADGGRLTIKDLLAVRETLGSALTPAEQGLVRRSLRRLIVQGVLVLALLSAAAITVLVDSRQTFVLAFEPPQGGAGSHVVVRVGRPRRGLMRLWPRSSTGGTLLADTGFSGAGMTPAASAQVIAGRAGGTLEPGGDDSVPNWLRDVVNGLRPVPRGVAKTLIGDNDGVTSLRQAFSDPLARLQTLDALVVIGQGRAGEDEILAAALGDASPEIRRRGVEVAAAIDRRLGRGAHVTTLRNALGDRSADVRLAVLREIETLPPDEATDVLATALREHDPNARRSAEDMTFALAVHHPEAAAEAAARVLESADGNARRNSLALLERIAGQAPGACAAVLERLVMNAKAPEEARVAALQVLRKAGPVSPQLKPALEQAVSQPSASPRLRTAALPLYARFIDPMMAEEIARAEMKGSQSARAAGTAVWGAIAIAHPDQAHKPLAALVYDPSSEVRLEAVRAYALLKRNGIPLVEKALRDPSAEVERAAIDSAMALAPINPYAVGTMLGKAVNLSRPEMRRHIVAALGHLGETRAAAALPPLAHTLKDQDVGTRTAAATALCLMSQKNAVAVAPYLRIAARDDARDVRAAAASCIGELANGDPRGGAKMAAQLAAAEEPSVRAAAAESLGRLAAQAPELALPALLKLIEDPDASVRSAAERGLAKFGEGGGAVDAAGSKEPRGAFAESKRAAEAERVLLAALARGEAAERTLIVTAAAKNHLPGVLRHAASDASESVRLQAVRGAGALKPPALDIVRGAVDDRASVVRSEATRILAATSGRGAREALPQYESALAGGDHAAREAAIVGLGELPGPAEPAVRLLNDALSQRSESLRAAAARALGRLAEHDPAATIPTLERALHDSSYDVAAAAAPGLALAWSRQFSPTALGDLMIASETDSARRFVALEALVRRAERSPEKTADHAATVAALKHVAETGPPLARLAARLGRVFLAAPPSDLHMFLARLLGT